MVVAPTRKARKTPRWNHKHISNQLAGNAPRTRERTPLWLLMFRHDGTREPDMQGCDGAVWLRKFSKSQLSCAVESESRSHSARPGGLPSEKPSFSPTVFCLFGTLGTLGSLSQIDQLHIQGFGFGDPHYQPCAICHVSLQPGALVHCKSYTLLSTLFVTLSG